MLALMACGGKDTDTPTKTPPEAQERPPSAIIQLPVVTPSTGADPAPPEPEVPDPAPPEPEVPDPAPPDPEVPDPAPPEPEVPDPAPTKQDPVTPPVDMMDPVGFHPNFTDALLTKVTGEVPTSENRSSLSGEATYSNPQGFTCTTGCLVFEGGSFVEDTDHTVSVEVTALFDGSGFRVDGYLGREENIFVRKGDRSIRTFIYFDPVAVDNQGQFSAENQVGVAGEGLISGSELSGQFSSDLSTVDGTLSIPGPYGVTGSFTANKE